MGTPETAEREMIIDLDVWRGLVLTATPAPRDGPVSIGIDLGGGTSMCAVAFYWPVTGRLEAYGAFPAKPSLGERGRRDGAGDRYERMLERGEIQVCGVWETDSVSFLQDRLGDIEDYEWLSIEADNYAKTKVKQAMHLLDRDVDSISFRRVGRGPEGKEDVEAFQSEVNTGHLSVGRNILLDSAIASSKLVRDTNGNPALRKDKHKGRIDPLQATLLAVGEGQRWRKPPGEDVIDPEAMGSLMPMRWPFVRKAALEAQSDTILEQIGRHIAAAYQGAGEIDLNALMGTSRRDQSIVYTALTRAVTLTTSVCARMITNGDLHVRDRDDKLVNTRRVKRTLDMLCWSPDNGATSSQLFFEDVIADYCLDGNGLLTAEKGIYNEALGLTRYNPFDAFSTRMVGGPPIYHMTETYSGTGERREIEARKVMHVRWPMLHRGWIGQHQRDRFSLPITTLLGTALGIGIEQDTLHPLVVQRGAQGGSPLRCRLRQR